MFTNKRDHVCRTIYASESRVEDKFCHPGGSLDLGLQDARLQRVKEPLIQQIGRHLIRYGTRRLDEHLIGNSGCLCCKDRHSDRRENIKVVGLPRQECLPIRMNRWELHAGRVNSFAFRPGIRLLCCALGVIRRV